MLRLKAFAAQVFAQHFAQFNVVVDVKYFRHGFNITRQPGLMRNCLQALYPSLHSLHPRLQAGFAQCSCPLHKE
jgi:hypothetical protein